MAKQPTQLAAAAAPGRLAQQEQTPCLDALRAYAARDPGRLRVPGHKGGAGADPALLESIGERALGLDIPALAAKR